MMAILGAFCSSWRWTICLSTLLFVLAAGDSRPQSQWLQSFLFMVIMFNISQRGRIPGLFWLPVAATCGMLFFELRVAPQSLSGSNGFFQFVLRSSMLFLLTSWAELCLRIRERADRNAKTDSLTGLLNRDGFEDRLRIELARIDRTHEPTGIVCLDGDGFKSINDERGHTAGDAYLKAVAQTLRESLRGYDSVARWGGDEFLILLPGCDAQATRQVLQRIQKHLAGLQVCAKPGITWSAGGVIVRNRDHIAQVLDAADQRMYAAKKQGRGGIVVEELGENNSPKQVPVNEIIQ